MKSLLFMSIMALFFVLPVNAQRNVRVLLGGGFGINYSKIDESASDKIEYSVSPEFGVRIYDKFDIGVGVSYQNKRDQYATYYDYSGEYTQIDYRAIGYRIKPFIKSVIFRANRLQWAAGLYTQVGNSKQIIDHEAYPNYGYKTFSIGLNSEIRYRATDRIEFYSATGIFSYEKQTDDRVKDESVTQINMLFNAEMLSLGMRFIF